MSKKNYTVEQIIVKMREIELSCRQGKSIKDSCRENGISDSTYFKWREKYGAMNTDEAKKYALLEKENARLKKLVADMALDNSILKEALANFS